MEPEELPDELYADVTALSEKGNELAEKGDYEEAINRFQSAYDLLPEPKDKWEAGMWLLASIGDCLFLQGNYQEACRYFHEAQKYPGGIENPFVFFRLGQCLYEIGGRLEESLDALISAYMLAGEDIFLKEDPKYLEFLKAHAEIGE